MLVSVHFAENAVDERSCLFVYILYKSDFVSEVVITALSSRRHTVSTTLMIYHDYLSSWLAAASKNILLLIYSLFGWYLVLITTTFDRSPPLTLA
jgi:hypothetical protein